MTRYRYMTLLAPILLLVLGAISTSADHVIDWYTIDGGGQMWTSTANFELSTTFGQTDTDGSLTMRGATLSLTGGFWPISATSFPGDCTDDGTIDLADYAIMETCLAGPEIEVDVGCHCADLDGDTDSDLADFAEFQRLFTSQ